MVLLKALADDSRHAILTELGRSDRPLSTVELAGRLDLHPNTVRLHLERLRDVGLVSASAEAHGSVGRPQHLWSRAPGAPPLGLEPDGSRVLAQLLADALASVGPRPEALLAAGRRSGASRAGAARSSSRRHRGSGGPADRCVDAVVAELAELGFDPVAEPGEGSARGVTFTGCPFRELAAAYPDLVCTLHRGVTEGILTTVAEQTPGVTASVASFSTLVDADPCRAELVVDAAPSTRDGTGPPAARD